MVGAKDCWKARSVVGMSEEPRRGPEGVSMRHKGSTFSPGASILRSLPMYQRSGQSYSRSSHPISSSRSCSTMAWVYGPDND